MLKYQILGEFAQWESSFTMRPYSHTDMTKLIVACRNIANAP